MEVENGEPVASSSRSSIVNVPTLDSFYDNNPQPSFDYASVKGHDPVICIDNGELGFLILCNVSKLLLRRVAKQSGSLNWRAGFSTMPKPYIDRPSNVSKFKDRKNGRTITLIGKDTLIDANSRSNSRSMFDGDLLIAGDVLVSPTATRVMTTEKKESALDYTFIKLGIDTGRVEHPIVMTERLANPLLTRASEFLGENQTKG